MMCHGEYMHPSCPKAKNLACDIYAVIVVYTDYKTNSFQSDAESSNNANTAVLIYGATLTNFGDIKQMKPLETVNCIYSSVFWWSPSFVTSSLDSTFCTQW